MWDYMCISEIGLLYQCVFMHVNVMMSKRAQIHRQWEDARISSEALRRSGFWRDQRRSNRHREPEWGRVPFPSTACLTQHTADRGEAHTLCPNWAKKD